MGYTHDGELLIEYGEYKFNIEALRGEHENMFKVYKKIAGMTSPYI